jgi:hypothetical protein
MSNALAIGAVTAVIRSLLENRLSQPDITGILGESVVSVLPPASNDGNGGTQNRDRLNLFFYQSTANSGWSNWGLPARNQNGDRLQSPPLALDLHYLITAYSQQAFHAEILMGYAMQVLHEMPVLSRETIRNALSRLASRSEPAFKALATADLAEQMEQIKITPQSMGTEELSKLWSAIQTQYRPTAAYTASVVLIEQARSLKSALPVLKRNLVVLPFQQPIIEAVQSHQGINQPIRVGDTILIQGRQLKGEATKVQIGGIVIPVRSPALTDTEITLPLTSPPFSPTDLSALRAGIQPVQVIQELILSTPGDLRRGFESNLAAFVLRPTIRRDPTSGAPQISVSAVQFAPNVPSFRVVSLILNPTVGKDQRVQLLLNRTGSGEGFSFVAAPRQQDGEAIAVQIPTTLPTGTYLVRVQVDRAESLPDLDLDLNSPTYSQFTGTPSLTLFP